MLKGQIQIHDNMASNSFKKLRLKRSAPISDRESTEARYWKKFTKPVSHILVAPPTHIHFCPTLPHHFAVTSSTEVKLYSSRSNSEIKSLTRFGDIAYCGVFRHDGRLLAAGDASGGVRLFDVESRSALRVFKGHSAAVQSVAWSPRGLQVLSGGDDKQVALWDIATQEKVQTFDGHGDYVRSAQALPSSEGLWLTAGYDRVVKVWDGRAGSQAVMVLDHSDASVETCLPLPTGTVVFSAGGTSIKAWDLVAGAGRELACFSNHSGTISTLCLDGTANRLLSAGLDGHVKVYNLQTYEVTHGLKFKAPVLSLALSPTNNRLVAGTTDNMISIRQRIEPKLDAVAIQASSLRGGSTRYFNRGKNTVAGADDLVVAVQRGQKLRPYEKALKRFEYQEALDHALSTRNPLIVAAMFEELRQRQGLQIALAGRDEISLEPILSFLNRYITQPKYAPLLIEVCQKVLDIYSQVLGQSEAIDELFLKLKRHVKAEIQFQSKMLKLLGGLDAIISASAYNTQADTLDVF